MNITVELQDARSFSLFWLLVGMICLAAAIFLLAPVLKTKLRRVKKEAVDERSAQEIYLEKLDQLEQQYLKNTISVRSAYQSLSKIVREYGSAVTGIPLSRLTLEEIRLHGSEKAAHLVERYYVPEFAQYAEDRFIKEIHYAKEVIRAWN